MYTLANKEFSNTLSEESIFEVSESKQDKYQGTSFEHGIKRPECKS